MKPTLVKTTAMVMTPNARLINDRLGGFSREAVSRIRSVADICFVELNKPRTVRRGALVLNLCECRSKEEDCSLALEGMNWPWTRLWKPALGRENRAAEAIGESCYPNAVDSLRRKE
jgi:hypothetical protein